MSVGITDREKESRVPNRSGGSLSRSWVESTIRNFQRGQRPAEHFELLFREYAPLIHLLLRRKGWKSPDLDDLVQEIMIRVYNGLKTFRFESSFETWLLRTMSNTAYNALRERQTGKAQLSRISLDRMFGSDEASGQRLSEPPDPEQGPLEDALSAERKERLMRALDQLPPRIRQCLLFRYQGYKIREIAQAQGVSVATVKKQLATGHKRIRPILGAFVEFFGMLIVANLLLLW